MIKNKMGWIPDLPDNRDYSAQDILKNSKIIIDPEEHLPKAYGGTPDKNDPLLIRGVKITDPSTKVDLRAFCSPIENQQNIGSCVSNATVGLLEYFENHAFGRFIDASRLFHYKTTRNLMGQKGDTGAFLRTGMQALATFGVLPEKYMPYDTSKFDIEPTAFQYSFASNYQALEYFRIDTYKKTPAQTLESIKNCLRNSQPMIFGFTVYSSISQADHTGVIPYPKPTDKVEGGHAVMCVGFDESAKLLIIRNSWGTEWGDKGYGYLPYDYVLNGLAVDWWSLIKAEWLDQTQFN